MVEVHIKANKLVHKKRQNAHKNDWLMLALLFQLIFVTITATVVSFFILFG